MTRSAVKCEPSDDYSPADTVTLGQPTPPPPPPSTQSRPISIRSTPAAEQQTAMQSSEGTTVPDGDVEMDGNGLSYVVDDGSSKPLDGTNRYRTND